MLAILQPIGTAIPKGDTLRSFRIHPVFSKRIGTTFAPVESKHLSDTAKCFNTHWNFVLRKAKLKRFFVTQYTASIASAMLQSFLNLDSLFTNLPKIP